MFKSIFVWLVLLMATAKTHTEKQALVAGTKQSKQANKADGGDQAGRLTWQSGVPNLFHACLLCFVPASSTLILLK